MEWGKRYRDLSGNADIRIRHEPEGVRLEVTTEGAAIIFVLPKKSAEALGRDLTNRKRS